MCSTTPGRNWICRFLELALRRAHETLWTFWLDWFQEMKFILLLNWFVWSAFRRQRHKKKCTAESCVPLGWYKSITQYTYRFQVGLTQRYFGCCDYTSFIFAVLFLTFSKLGVWATLSCVHATVYTSQGILRMWNWLFQMLHIIHCFQLCIRWDTTMNLCGRWSFRTNWVVYDICIIWNT